MEMGKCSFVGECVDYTLPGVNHITHSTSYPSLDAMALTLMGAS